MIIKKCLVIGLSLIILLVGVLAACATPAPRPTPTLTPTIPTTKPLSPALAEIIAGAKKEGTVSVVLRSGFTPTSIERLKKEIKGRFGVDLDIKYTPSVSMPKNVAAAILEYKSGATPSFDFITIGPDHTLPGLKEGVFELLDWKSLLPEDVSHEVLVSIPPYGQVGLSSYTTLEGMLYNPEKVPAAQVPQTLRDLADPKWKGRIGIQSYAASWTVWSFILGREKTVADLRGVLKNKAIQGVYADLYNRYLLGEIWFALIGDSYWKMALDKGMPASWQNMEIVLEAQRPQVVLKGAAHPNAAKLVAIYLATPGGAKFVLEESGATNACYPGSHAYDIRMQAVKQGLPLFFYSDQKLIEFLQSEESGQWQSEIELILKTGG